SMCEFWEDASGTLWLSGFTGNGYLAKWEMDRFTLQPLPTGCPTTRPLRLWPEARGEMWVLTTNQFGPLLNGRFVPLAEGEFIPTEARDSVVTIGRSFWPFKCAAGGFWMKRTDGMERIEFDGKISSSITFPEPLRGSTGEFMEDRLGNIWVLGENG